VVELLVGSGPAYYEADQHFDCQEHVQIVQGCRFAKVGLVYIPMFTGARLPCRNVLSGLDPKSVGRKPAKAKTDDSRSSV
jgi:hypothetical protein